VLDGVRVSVRRYSMLPVVAADVLARLFEWAECIASGLRMRWGYHVEPWRQGSLRSRPVVAREARGPKLHRRQRRQAEGEPAGQIDEKTELKTLL